MKSSRRAIVIGASAGGVETLNEVVCRLPADLPAPVFVVLHIPPFVASSLPQILSRSGPLPAIHPEDGAAIEPGIIYVAPPDHHLLIMGDSVTVKKGPKENRFRPSIDALFRSAAYVYGPGAIGVVLSGALDDGTSGLWSIKRLGGTAIVQQPNQARFESMPRSALEHVEVDYNLPSTEIGALLGRLANERPPTGVDVESNIKTRMGTESKVAAEGGAFQKGIMDLGALTPFTCPECHGALVRIAEGKMSRFRCHTGHAYTDSALLEAVMESTGGMLWQVIRSLEESAMLLTHMGRHLEEAGDTGRAKLFLEKAKVLEKRSSTFHADVLSHESLSGDNLAQ
ncbi:MAG TPA: chemotaxis protein CheB [Tepidisphaeraceae bacterium]|jgi:two-component system chemotaxis response regulator CheB|nr:chemotaxis protein CheB [Tepidisphaeraceae bacterium]